MMALARPQTGAEEQCEADTPGHSRRPRLPPRSQYREGKCRCLTFSRLRGITDQLERILSGRQRGRLRLAQFGRRGIVAQPLESIAAGNVVRFTSDRGTAGNRTQI